MIDLENIKNFTSSSPKGWSLLGNDDDIGKLPITHQQQILFLDEKATEYIYEFYPNANLLTGGAWDPFAKGNFKQVEEFDRLYQTEEGKQELKKWLFKSGIAFPTWVFVVENGNHGPMLITWKMLIKYSADIFFGQDILVFDKTLNWCLLYFHENQLFFGKDQLYDPAEDEQRMKELNDRKKKYPQFKHPYYK